MKIQIKRIYEPVEKNDDYRILVDRLWPRGIKKEDAHIDEWLKEVAPSTELRKWFGHDPEKWDAFLTKYKSELEGSEAFAALMATAKKHKNITLVYAAKDEQHNQAVALQQMMHAKK